MKPPSQAIGQTRSADHVRAAQRAGMADFRRKNWEKKHIDYNGILMA